MSDRAVQKPIWAALVVPSAACGLALAPVAGWMFGPLAAATVFAVCLADAILLGWVVERFRRDASAQLRRPELRGEIGYQAGVFRPLLAEALLQIEELEQRAAVAAQAKTELEARVHLNRRRLRHFVGTIDATSEPVILTDASGRVLHANPAAGRLFRPEETAARKTGTLTESELSEIPPVVQAIRQVLDRPLGASRTVEFSVDGAAGVTHRAVVRPITDDDGQLLGTSVQIDDVQHETAERQRHAEFVSSVCHELKTPMASIRAYTELLRDGDAETDEERAELCSFIDSQVDRLTRLVNNMLNLARIQSGVVKVQRDDCELNDVLQPAIETVRHLAEEKNIRLLPELSDLYLAVHADKDLLRQAVINLLSNAVKYTPAGGEVRLRSRLAGDRCVIEVKDSGMGIPAECLPRLFERFYRVPRNNSAAAGTGLGLALVKYIVTDLHNGSITVQTEVDTGSTFTISLPFGHLDKLPRRDAAKKTIETT
ncbi:MAG: cell wall metabolism sensor histidine kinase WalK [Planctomycetota bacterium]|nr:PAS domain-containing protein [Planctomycetaceae bacterium]MDQ3332992.1 cell wall metabolism sensor histidine kinase WalK [Planctomycetota bacterium]